MCRFNKPDKKPMDYLIDLNWYRDFDYIINVMVSCGQCCTFNGRGYSKLINAYHWGHTVLSNKIDVAVKQSGYYTRDFHDCTRPFFDELMKKRELIELEMDANQKEYEKKYIPDFAK